MYFPSLEQFREKAKQGNLIPVYREIVADLETPVSAFLKIDRGEHSYLLESVVQGEKIGQYSFLGANPSVVFKSKGNKVEISRNGGTETRNTNDPLSSLKELMSSYKPVAVEGLPRFHGGAVGYLGYDTVRFFERLPDVTVDDLDLPDAYFIITDTILIFDHINHTIKVVSNAHISGDPDEAYNQAIEKIDQLTAALKAATPVPPSKTSTARKQISMRSNFTRRDFEGIVRRAKEYIKAGDIFQVVLSQRFSRKIKSPPINIYRALRCVNPSPYMFYISLGSLKLVGTSPELLVRVEDGVMTLRPIAGTRRRGKTPREDHELEIDLLSDEKELAEHIMLVDLGRNDVGRVCKYGTVRPTEMKVIERYSHVMHIVSNVEGRLRRSEDLYSAVRAAFPMGTVSGAPKIRAMEIIEELEPTRRGPYGGAVGYVGFSGNFDSCITIRTLIIKDDVAYLQAGAGIVADSVPSREHVECKNKARALVKAIELAEQGFLDR